VDCTIYHDDLYSQPEETDFSLRPNAVGCLPRVPIRLGEPELGVWPRRGLQQCPVSSHPIGHACRRTPPAACSYCYHREDVGGESYRQNSNRRFVSEPGLNRRIASTGPDGTVPEFHPARQLVQPALCDVRLPDQFELGHRQAPGPVGPPPSTRTATTTDSGAAIRENSTLLRRMCFAGGEPFPQSGHFRMLDLLIIPARLARSTLSTT